jgi:hypothetical protein
MDLKTFVEKINNFINVDRVQKAIVDVVAPISAETLNWIGVILIHASTIPMLLAVFTGLSDRMPPIDMVLLMWGGLIALFVQAAVINNRIQMFTISAGFMIQSILMALIFFR